MRRRPGRRFDSEPTKDFESTRPGRPVQNRFFLARLSRELGTSPIDALTLLSVTAFTDPASPVLELLQTAAASPMDGRSVAALAVHLVDVVEAMAIKIYVPELPGLVAKSDRTGEAARSVGLARHLRG